MSQSSRGKNVPNFMSIKVCDDLYNLIADEADENEEAMIDVIVRVLADHFERPELGRVPRRPQGRKRVKHPA